MRRIRSLMVITCFIIACLCMTGCKSQSTDTEKIKDLEFTVVKASEIPEELMQLIEQRKANEFKFTFNNKDEGYLYMVVGYGQQATGGYSVQVESLYLTKNSIYLDTSLMGPTKDDVVTQAVTYPYIVVKIPYMDLPVTFI